MRTDLPWTRRVAGLLLLGLLAASGAAAAPAPSPTSVTSPAVDVIVTATDDEVAADLVADHGGTVDTALPYLGAVTATLSSQAAAVLDARADVTVTEDVTVEVTATDLVPVGPADVDDQPQLAAMALPEHWTASSGAGIGVALLDTGVAEVPELDGRLVRGPDYSGDGDGIDRHGHGTFMAGLIAGDGRVSGGDEPRFGVAPGAHIVSVKLAGRDGATSLGRVLEAIGWVIVNQDDHAIRVMNLSLGVSTNRAPQADPLAAAVEAAWASGITVVTASGNEGRGEVTSPGRDPWVITVGSFDQHVADPTVPDWSGAGKVVSNPKPEVLAPGVSTVSLRAPGSAVEQDHPDAHVDDRYLRGSGTSMSAALVSGAVAVLAELRPFATPDDLKGALVSTGDTIRGETGVAIDLAAADAAEVSANWRQRHKIVFDGPSGRLRSMPWNDGGTPSAGEAWQRAKWMDGAWHRAKWMDGAWHRAKWMDGPWSRAKWMEGPWTRAKWMDEAWQRAKWMEDAWARAKWMEASWARAKWMDASFTRAKWMEADWARAKWMVDGWSDGSAVTAPASFGGPDRASDPGPPGRGNGRGRP